MWFCISGPWKSRVHLEPHIQMRPLQVCTVSNRKLEDDENAQWKRLNLCNQCNYMSPLIHVHWGHFKAHIREKTNKCNQCQFASHQGRNLRRHLSKNFGSSKVSMLSKICIVFVKNSQQIWIRILFDLRKSLEYKYE